MCIHVYVFRDIQVRRNICVWTIYLVSEWLDYTAYLQVQSYGCSVNTCENIWKMYHCMYVYIHICMKRQPFRIVYYCNYDRIILLILISFLAYCLFTHPCQAISLSLISLKHISFSLHSGALLLLKEASISHSTYFVTQLTQAYSLLFIYSKHTSYNLPHSRQADIISQSKSSFCPPINALTISCHQPISIPMMPIYVISNQNPIYVIPPAGHHPIYLIPPANQYQNCISTNHCNVSVMLATNQRRIYI